MKKFHVKQQQWEAAQIWRANHEEGKLPSMRQNEKTVISTCINHFPISSLCNLKPTREWWIPPLTLRNTGKRNVCYLRIQGMSVVEKNEVQNNENLKICKEQCPHNISRKALAVHLGGAALKLLCGERKIRCMLALIDMR